MASDTSRAIPLPEPADFPDPGGQHAEIAEVPCGFAPSLPRFSHQCGRLGRTLDTQILEPLAPPVSLSARRIRVLEAVYDDYSLSTRTLYWSVTTGSFLTTLSGLKNSEI